METADLRIDVHLDAEAWRKARIDNARQSLSAQPRSLDPVWFYDQRGSDLFDEITRLPEYYPTRVERALLGSAAAEIMAEGPDTLVELGSGTSDKTTTLLDAMAAAGTLRHYVPLDVSEETLRSAADSLMDRYPGMDVHGVVGDFHHHLELIPDEGRRVVAFLGGTIGNFRPAERARFWFDLDCALHRDDALLVGIGLINDPDRMVAAYDDAAGVTAAFNRNALTVLNRELGGDFVPEAFDHVALWNEVDRWIEMRLRSQRRQSVHVEQLGLDLELAAGEEILTEISAKFDLDDFVAELYTGGFVAKQTWVAPDQDYALVLAHPYC